MLDLIVTLTTISLIDSLSMLPFAIVVLAVLLSGRQPYLTATGFLLGIFVSYLASGILIAFGLGETINKVTEVLVHWFKNPNALDYYLSMVVGVLLIVFGYAWATARRKKAEQKKQADPGMGPVQAFLLGGGAVLAGLWGALPYFAAVDTILKENLAVSESIVALTYYNVIFVSSGVVVVLIRAVMGERADGIFAAVNRFIAVWGKRVIITLMVLLGLVMLADGVGWLAGRPLIPTG
jgi:hypothetical protein